MFIFNVASSPAELPSFNANMARMIYEQYPPIRSVSGPNFSNGMIDIRFEVSGTKWWIPSRSYIRMRAKLVNGVGPDGVPVVLSDGIAPNMGLMGNLFTSIEFQIANKTVSRISELLAQVDALDKRMTNSKSWLENVGKLNWWQPNQADRLHRVSSDGLEAQPGDPFSRIPQLSTVPPIPEDTTLAYATATKIVTFAGAPDVRLALNVGDVLIIGVVNNNFGVGDRLEITALSSATTAVVQFQNIPNPGDQVAAVENFVVERRSQFINNVSTQRGGFEMIWQPPLGIFKLPHALPAGQYRMLLNPKPAADFQLNAIESQLSDPATKVSGLNNDFRFVVENMYLYVNTVESARVDDKVYFLSLDEIRCQTDNVLNSAGLQQRFFDVSPSTYGMALAFQDQNVLNDTRRSASKFKIRERADGNTPGGADLYLTRLYINYGGVNKPQPDADPSFESPDNRMSQLYATTILYNGLYFSSSGPESEADWRDRGPYYYYAWPRDGTSESTRVTVNYQFSPQPENDSGRVLLFDLSHKVVMITIKDGRVTDVQEQDA